MISGGALWIRTLRESAVFKRILAPSGGILVSNLVATVFGLVALALATRSMSLSDFGLFSLTTSYAFLISRLVGFQSWQPILRFIEMPSNGDPTQRSTLFSLGLKLDVVAAVAACLVAIAATPIMMISLRLSGDVAWAVAIYCIVNATVIAGAPTAVLRHFRRYDLIAAQTVLAAGLKVAGVGVVLALGGGFEGCLLVWGLTQGLGNFVLVEMGQRVARQGGSTMFAKVTRLDLRRFPGLLRSFIDTNLVQTAKMLRDGDILLVGYLIGLEAAGIFRIARQLGDIAVKATDSLMVVLFPEFTRLMGKGDFLGPKKLVLATLINISMIGLIVIGAFFVFGDTVLVHAFGENFSSAKLVTGICMLAGLVRAVSQVAPAALLASGNAQRVLLILVVTGILYYSCIAIGSELFGIVGIGLALLVSNLVTAALLTSEALKMMNRRAKAQ